MAAFAIGDKVDVYDLRDGTCVERGAKIERLETTREGQIATLDCGFAVSTRCLRHASPFRFRQPDERTAEGREVLRDYARSKKRD